MSDRPPSKAIIPPERGKAWPVLRPAGSAGSGTDGAEGAEGANPSPGSGPKAIRPPGRPAPAPSSSVTAETTPGSLIADALDVTADVVGAVTGVLTRRLAGESSDGDGRDRTLEVDPDARRLRGRKARIILDCGETDTVRHVGVIFVHGIGSQAAGETLRDWGGSIVRVLTQVRIGENAPADPVVTTQLDPTSGHPMYIEVELPPIKNADGTIRVDAEHWVMTEAWWAQRVAPPSFASMAKWLGPDGAVRRILTAMFAAQEAGDPRQRSASEAHRLERDQKGAGPSTDPSRLATKESDIALSMLSQPVASARRETDEATTTTTTTTTTTDPSTRGTKANARVGSGVRPGPLAGGLERLGVGLFLQAVSALVLLLYGFLRSIEKLLPIDPLKDGALTRPIDNFLLNWFGDVHVLLGDPAQSASIRAQLVDAIWDLAAIQCEPVTIVAHSGGAIVTYMTLADPMTAELKVNRVVTHGEAANLAWRLTDNGRPAKSSGDEDPGYNPADRIGDLYRSITNRTHRVLWTDMWASQDPAPVGLMAFPRVDLPDVESIGVWNRMSFREDHGTYWTNDEEFVIPLLRRLVAVPKDAEGDRFGSDDDHLLRSKTRRQRIAVLSFWSQFCRSLPTIAIVHSFAIGAATIFSAGEMATAFWNMIPGHELISDPVDALRATRAASIPSGSPGDWVAQLGVWVIAAVLASSAIFSLRAPPERSALFRTKLWTAYDVFYAVALRALVLFLLVLATEKFIGAENRLPAWLVVLGVVALAGLEVVLARWIRSREAGGVRRRIREFMSGLQSRIAGAGRRARIAPGVAFAVPTGAIAAALAVALLLVVAPFLAMALFPRTANIVLGTIVIFFAFQLLLAVGKWRWMAWDERARLEMRHVRDKPHSDWAVGIQMTIHMVAGVLLYFGIVRSDLTPFGIPLIVAAAVTAGVAVLIGIGIDVVSAGKRREDFDGGRMAGFIQTKQ